MFLKLQAALSETNMPFGSLVLSGLTAEPSILETLPRDITANIQINAQNIKKIPTDSDSEDEIDEEKSIIEDIFYKFDYYLDCGTADKATIEKALTIVKKAEPSLAASRGLWIPTYSSVDKHLLIDAIKISVGVYNNPANKNLSDDEIIKVFSQDIAVLMHNKDSDTQNQQDIDDHNEHEAKPATPKNSSNWFGRFFSAVICPGLNYADSSAELDCKAKGPTVYRY